MKIGELSRRSGVSVRSLRYYEQQALLSARREPNGYRDYDESAVERAATIHMLFSMDFSREFVHSVLACSGQASSDASHHQLTEQVKLAITDIERRIKQFTAVHQSMNDFLQRRGEAL